MTVSCENCAEAIQPDAKQCPHCGDKRMTQERYLLYLVVYLPVIAAIAGSVLYGIFAASSPEVTINWLLGLILVCYLGGAYIAKSKRDVVREKLPDQEDG